MAEKIIQTRIISKHITLDQANNGTWTPYEGEIVLARVDTQKPDGHGGVTVVPTYLMKVGAKDSDGNLIAIKDLQWTHAPASDVYAWAKADTKPTYSATEIATDSGSNLEEEITALKAAVGNTEAVQGMIKAAIEALDVEDAAVGNQFVTAVAEADGKISITRRELTAEDIPALGLDKITGLEDALDAKAVESSVAERFTAVTTRLDSGDIKQGIDAAKKAGDDAQAYAEGIYKVDGETKTGVLAQYMTSNDAEVADVRAIAEAARTKTEVDGQIDAKLNPVIGRVEAIEADYTKAEEARTIADEQIAAFKTATVDPIDDRLETVEGKVNALSSATHFLGVKDKLDDVESPAAGDIVIVGDKEYVYDTAKGWVELGDTTAELAKIDAIDKRVEAIEADLGEDGDTTKAIAAAQKAADDAQDYAEGVASDLADEIDRATKAEAAILGTADDASTANTVFGAKKFAEEKASAAEANAKADTEQKVSALATTVSTNAETAAGATKQVADDLAAYETSNDAALELVRQNAQKGVDDAAAALAYAKDVETNKVDKNTEAIAAIETDIAANVAKVRAVEGATDKFELAVGDDVIIFDCGSVE